MSRIHESAFHSDLTASPALSLLEIYFNILTIVIRDTKCKIFEVSRHSLQPAIVKRHHF